MTIRTRLSRNVGMTGLSLGVVAICGFAALYFNARALGIELLGVFAAILALSLMLEALAGMQSWQAIVTLNEENEGRIFGAALMINAGTAIIATLTGIVFLFALDFGGGWAGIFHIATLLLRLSDPAMGVLRKHNQFGYLAAVRAGVAVSTLGLAILWYFTAAPIEAYLVSSALVQTGQAALFNIRSWRFTRPKRPTQAIIRRVFAFVFPTGLSGGIGAIRQGGVLVLVGFVAGGSAAGLYAVADRIAGLMRMGYRAVFEALFREMPDIAKPASIIASVAGFGVLLSAVAVAAAHWLGPWVINLAAGAPFTPAASVLTVLVAAVSVTIVTLALRAWIIIAVGPNSMLACNVIALLALTPAPFLINNHGVPGAAWAVLISELAWTVAALIVSWRNRAKLTHNG